MPDIKIRSQNKKRRITISLPQDTYNELESLALSQDVSIAWMLRAAAKQYISSNLSLRTSSSEKGVNHGKL